MQQLPDAHGRYGDYGGKFVPETLMSALAEVESAYDALKDDPAFESELDVYLRDYAGRPTPLYFAAGLSKLYGHRIYLKREDLCHTGSHKINNALGQALIAKRMGKRRVVAETGAGQHGVATATVCALFGMECHIYMGEEDVDRQSLNVFRMKLLGAEVVPVSSGTKTLKDAMNEAIRDWVTNVETTHYLLGSVAGPHPYPMIVRDLQRIIGDEAKKQVLGAEGRLPDAIVACVGGGSNAMGIFYSFIGGETKLFGVEAAGLGLASGKHGASLGCGEKGVLHGSLSYVLQNAFGQIMTAHSISAGLDYPGVGPEHAYFKDTGLATYDSVTDIEALQAFKRLSAIEGILPALESAHALAYLEKLAPRLEPDSLILVSLSGRGDKDVNVVAEALG